jgi:hypothetical protein
MAVFIEGSEIVLGRGIALLGQGQPKLERFRVTSADICGGPIFIGTGQSRLAP